MTAAAHSPSLADASLQVGAMLVGKYRIDGILGEGGMGVVLAAHHLELDQKVAIKVLHQDAANYHESEERFRREARVAAKIQSDHVTRVLDVGVLDSGDRFMVMEHLEGRDLGAELGERGCFSIGTACGLVLEALDALQAAHSAGIVHRDIKPENLFLTRRSDGGYRLKVLDFGISKLMGEADSLSLTKTSEWIGTPLYMSPEQMQSPRNADARSDLWSLGAVLFELISGRPPYEVDSLPQLCNLLLTQDPPDIREIRPEVPRELADIITKTLTRDPAQRTPSAEQFASGLAQFASSLSSSSRKPSLLAATELADSPVAISQIRALSNASRNETQSNTRASSRAQSKLYLGAVVTAALLLAAMSGFILRETGKSGKPVITAPSAPEKSEQPHANSQHESMPPASKAAPLGDKALDEEESPQEPATAPVKPAAAPVKPAAAPVKPAVSAPAITPPRAVAPRLRKKPTPPTSEPPQTDEFAEFGGRR